MNAQVAPEERRYLQRLLQMEGNGLGPVVLVGSWARGLSIPSLSDIDVLVVGKSPPKIPRPKPVRIQVLTMTFDELAERVAKGNDFAQWALRFGKPIRGRKIWDILCQSLLPGAPWPDPRDKRQKAARRLGAARELFDMGDADAAQEELRFALSHLARAELLEIGVFPLSRPELPQQLREQGRTELAELLEQVNSLERLDPKQLRAALEVTRSRSRPDDEE